MDMKLFLVEFVEDAYTQVSELMVSTSKADLEKRIEEQYESGERDSDYGYNIQEVTQVDGYNIILNKEGLWTKYFLYQILILGIKE